LHRADRQVDLEQLARELVVAVLRAAEVRELGGRLARLERVALVLGQVEPLPAEGVQVRVDDRPG
jgi:hypothetical protein